ncbi:4Fe-4S dicluster domain-containing protein [Oceanirhabdus seepicola]|nr:4Fe-4S dicluster domain-containing protein [Oceanirhabdus seepicola]
MGKGSNVELMKFESDVQQIKYDVLKEVASVAFQGIDCDVNKIAKKMVPGPKPISRCCIYHEREIIRERVILANGGDIGNENIIEVIPAACDECPIDRYKITEACRGCLSHKCAKACPFNAIEIVGGRPVINYDLCKECGRCQKACPYNAIADIQRPCIRACGAKSISINDEKKAVIDNSKCVSCGQCSQACPFGAIMDKSQISDVIKDIVDESRQHNIYAIIAPAIASQFTFANIGQVVSAIKKVGFNDVVEVALGADIIAEHEAKEFAEVMEDKEFMTTSCCPAFVEYITKNYPELIDNMSTSVSPMIATARLIKDTDKNAKVAFIGPCMAKKMEAKKSDIEDGVDYVLTFEELLAMLDAADINVKECPEAQLNNGSYYGRIFARSGGVTEAIIQAIKEYDIQGEFKPIKCDGLKECDKALKMAKIKRLQGNFIEGMACEGGCIHGAGSISFGPKSKTIVDQYGDKAIEKKIKDSLRIFNIDKIKLHRKH